MPDRLVLQHTRQVRPGQQARHRDVAAEELVAHRDHPHAVANQRFDHSSPVLARQDGHRRVPPRPDLHSIRHSWRPIAQTRGAVHRLEEPALNTPAFLHPPRPRGLEGSAHPDAVLVLEQVLVAVQGGERALRQEVVLVCGEHHPATQHGKKHLLPVLNHIHDRRGLVPPMDPHGRLRRVPAHPERDACERLELGVLIENANQRVLQDNPVVDARAEDDLAVHLDPGIEQRPQPPEAGRAPRVAQQAGPDLGIGGVNAHPQR